jgi:hypothetical protein
VAPPVCACPERVTHDAFVWLPESPALDAHLLLRGIVPDKWDEETKEKAARRVVKTPQMTTPLEWAAIAAGPLGMSQETLKADGYENMRLIRARSAK